MTFPRILVSALQDHPSHSVTLSLFDLSQKKTLLCWCYLMVWSMSKGKIDSGNVLELDQEHFTRINFMHHRFFNNPLIKLPANILVLKTCVCLLLWKKLCNVWCNINQTKHSSVLLLPLVRFLLHQTLHYLIQYLEKMSSYVYSGK